MAISAKSMIFILAMALVFALILQQESRISAADPSDEIFRFAFSSFPPTSTANISVFGDAQPTARGYLQLTSDGQNINLTSSVGRALYSKPITLWSPLANYTASFNTSFTFAIRNVTASGFGNGMAFVMASALGASPSDSQGGMLGLSNFSIDGNQSNHFVAIEFDTYQNFNRNFKYHDVDSNHIGLDINGVVSKIAVQLNNTGINLKSGNLISAWIDYDGHAKQLDVFLSENKLKPTSAPLLSDNIDLSQFILQEMYVGFTGSTGQTVELHDVYSWEFSSTRLQTSSDPDTASSPASKIVSTNPKAGRTSAAAAVAGMAFNEKLIICVVLGVSLVMCGAVCALLLAYYCLDKRRRIIPIAAARKSLKEMSSDPSAFILAADFLYGPRKFTYKELSAATNQFSEKQVLGRGGFGSVYKGILPSNATMIAVKRTSKTSSQGEREFIAEVSIIGRLRHRNLVPLLGWCHRKGDLLLVYEFMPNGSLDQLLFAAKEHRQFLDWTRRYKIMCGLAAALLYLHEEWEDQVVHRDVKASNVMLDANFTARLGDFGLARLIQHNKLHAETTMAAGTLGYLAPEVSQTGKATTKSDVYSFGAVALEVACGRRPIDRTLPHDESILLDWVWDLHAEDRIMDAADPRLELQQDETSPANSNVCSEVKCMLQVGLACSHPDPDARPTIRQVLQILNGDAPVPPIPTTKPVPNYFPFSFHQIFADMAAQNAAPMQQQLQQQQQTAQAAHAAPAKSRKSVQSLKTDSMSFTELETSAIATSAGIALLR